MSLPNTNIMGLVIDVLKSQDARDVFHFEFLEDRLEKGILCRLELARIQ